jgi:mono/diheme cytochrome c family protein
MLFLGGNEWVAPPEAKKLVNPLKGNTASIEAGQKIFKQQCSMCHGTKGKGDGMAGMSLNPHPANLTSEKVQQQTDGEIFWKISTGRNSMPSYKNILSEEQRWQVVNYIRTLKTK